MVTFKYKLPGEYEDASPFTKLLYFMTCDVYTVCMDGLGKEFPDYFLQVRIDEGGDIEINLMMDRMVGSG